MQLNIWGGRQECFYASAQVQSLKITLLEAYEFQIDGNKLYAISTQKYTQRIQKIMEKIIMAGPSSRTMGFFAYVEHN